jgi:hypothetical protein
MSVDDDIPALDVPSMAERPADATAASGFLSPLSVPEWLLAHPAHASIASTRTTRTRRAVRWNASSVPK